jgi:hypothetical protein
MTSQCVLLYSVQYAYGKPCSKFELHLKKSTRNLTIDKTQLTKIIIKYIRYNERLKFFVRLPFVRAISRTYVITHTISRTYVITHAISRTYVITHAICRTCVITQTYAITYDFCTKNLLEPMEFVGTLLKDLP